MADKKPVKVEAVDKVTMAELDAYTYPSINLEHREGQMPQEVVRRGKELGIEVFWDSIRVEQFKSVDTGVITTRAYGYGYKDN